MSIRTDRRPLTPYAPSRARPPQGPRGPRGAVVLAGLVGGVVVLAVLAVVFWSGASLEPDGSALARVDVQPLGGTLARARAESSDGHAIPLTVRDGRLTPRTKLTPGQTVVVHVVVRRPGALAWALGRERRQRLVVRAPVAHPVARYLTVAPGAPVRVAFDRPVVAAAAATQDQRAVPVRPAGRTVDLGRRPAAGAVHVATAARPWERLGAAEVVSWFPRSGRPVAVATPGPDSRVAPAEPIRLTFSRPVATVLGDGEPQLQPRTPGKWSRPDDHTLLFTPSGYGFPFSSHVHVTLPRAVAVTGPAGATPRVTRDLALSVPGGSVLRLHQLLAQAGYLPVVWRGAGRPVAHTPEAEVRAAVSPPRGKFAWRYPHTPGELKHLWSETHASEITRGAVMKVQTRHGLTADAIAGPQVWRVLLADAIKGYRHSGGYSYVYAHRDASPAYMTLWHNGRTVMTSPGNPGVASAPTALGTYPVFEHLRVGTMSGTNPGGGTYSDPGIQYISYFNGGDALHAFDRASFGSPQSVGCFELPLAAAAKVWPYTPIGTLVTIEH